MHDVRSDASRLRHRRAQIEQRHLQFGQRCSLDVDGLLKAADRVQEASGRTLMKQVPPPGCRHAHGPAILGDFTSTNEACTTSNGEWIATLADQTAIVIDDSYGKPSLLGIEKAVSIVQSRYYLEQRARRLLMPFAESESVRLVAIDFASGARRHGSEFLMCFAVRDASGAVSSTSPIVKVGFGLPAPVAVDSVFVLTVVAAVGFW